MEDGYVISLKQAILDYILLDTNEQARLGVTLPEQVGFISLKHVPNRVSNQIEVFSLMF